MQSSITFLGGVGSVTGAHFMLSSEAKPESALLIDCGLFQGSREQGERNHLPFPYDVTKPSALLITHAHIDHIGRIPALVKAGFRGRIISTEATRALAEPLLLDSQKLLAQYAKRDHIESPYEVADVEKALSLWEGISYEEVLELSHGYQVRFLNAGHILGSAMIEIVRDGKKLLVTGDLGNDHSLLVEDATHVADADYLLIESVYGDRNHEGIVDRAEHLERVIESTIARGGTLVIPAFSTERTQDLIFEIRTLYLSKRTPAVPVYVDSPLASKITKIFTEYPQYLKTEIQERIGAGENIFSFPELRFVTSSEESEALHGDRSPKIVIAGSGMSEGGRVRSHERAYLSDSKNTVLIVGYQSAGSVGRHLIEGEKSVLIDNEKVVVAARIETLYGYTAHRDGDGLLHFVHRSASTLKRVFVVMGELKSSMFLTQRIRDFIGIRAETPQEGSVSVIEL